MFTLILVYVCMCIHKHNCYTSMIILKYSMNSGLLLIKLLLINPKKHKNFLIALVQLQYSYHTLIYEHLHAVHTHIHTISFSHIHAHIPTHASACTLLLLTSKMRRFIRGGMEEIFCRLLAARRKSTNVILCVSPSALCSKLWDKFKLRNRGKASTPSTLKTRFINKRWNAQQKYRVLNRVLLSPSQSKALNHNSLLLCLGLFFQWGVGMWVGTCLVLSVFIF